METDSQRHTDAIELGIIWLISLFRQEPLWPSRLSIHERPSCFEDSGIVGFANVRNASGWFEQQSSGPFVRRVAEQGVTEK